MTVRRILGRRSHALKVWPAILVCTVAACGGADVGVQPNAAPIEPASSAPGGQGPNPKAAPSTPRVGIDERGHRYSLVDEIRRPGQRVDFDRFLELTRNGPVTGPTGLTLGPIPEVPDGQIEAEQRLAPDLIPHADPNGSGTIVGFVRKSDFYSAIVPAEMELLAADGRTVVGVWRSIVIDHEIVDVEFVPHEVSK